MNEQNNSKRYGDFFEGFVFLSPPGRHAGGLWLMRERPKNKGFPDDILTEQEKRIIVRKARLKDRVFVISLGKHLFKVYGPYEEAISRWFDYKTTSTFIAESDRMRVGFIMLGPSSHRQDPSPSFELLAIGLHASSRRKGIGNRMMETVEKHAAHQGLDRIFLHTAVGNYPAQQLFFKRGYKPWGFKPGFYPAGQDAMVMLKMISPPGYFTDG